MSEKEQYVKYTNTVATSSGTHRLSCNKRERVIIRV